MILVIVQDTGIDISAEHLPHVFERFYKGDQARNNASSGAGLGLTMANRIIEAHQGKIDLSSRPGEGTRVLVWLPVDDGLQRAPFKA